MPGLSPYLQLRIEMVSFFNKFLQNLFIEYDRYDAPIICECTVSPDRCVVGILDAHLQYPYIGRVTS